MHRELVVQLGIDHVAKLVSVGVWRRPDRSTAVTIVGSRLLCRLIDWGPAGSIGGQNLGRCRWVRQWCQRSLESLLGLWPHGGCGRVVEIRDRVSSISSIISGLAHVVIWI